MFVFEWYAPRLDRFPIHWISKWSFCFGLIIAIGCVCMCVWVYVFAIVSTHLHKFVVKLKLQVKFSFCVCVRLLNIETIICFAPELPLCVSKWFIIIIIIIKKCEHIFKQRTTLNILNIKWNYMTTNYFDWFRNNLRHFDMLNAFIWTNGLPFYWRKNYDALAKVAYAVHTEYCVIFSVMKHRFHKGHFINVVCTHACMYAHQKDSEKKKNRQKCGG